MTTAHGNTNPLPLRLLPYNNLTLMRIMALERARINLPPGSRSMVDVTVDGTLAGKGGSISIAALISRVPGADLSAHRFSGSIVAKTAFCMIRFRTKNGSASRPLRFLTITKRRSTQVVH